MEAQHQAKIEYYHDENDKLRKTLRDIDASVTLKCKYGREAKAKPQQKMKQSKIKGKQIVKKGPRYKKANTTQLSLEEMLKSSQQK